MGNPIAFGKLFEDRSANWLVNELIREGDLALFAGTRQSGKTILALLLAQSIATQSVFLSCLCTRHPVAYFNRYDRKRDLWSLAGNVAPKMMRMDVREAAIYGCWKPEDTMPNVDDERLQTLANKGYLLILDTISGPRQTDCPDEFLRHAQRLARSGPGLVMFGASSWNRVQAVRNRVDAHFMLSKIDDTISFEDARRTVSFNLHLTPKGSPFEIKLRQFA